MSDPSRFIMTSDFATTQNDAKGTLSYTIPAGTVIASGATAVFQATAILGTRNAYMRPQFSTSSLSGRWFAAWTIVSELPVNISGVGTVSWFPYHSLERTSASSIRIYCEIFNNSGASMTVSTAQTITCEVNTFLSPFPS